MPYHDICQPFNLLKDQTDCGINEWWKKRSNFDSTEDGFDDNWKLPLWDTPEGSQERKRCFDWNWRISLQLQKQKFLIHVMKYNKYNTEA